MAASFTSNSIGYDVKGVRAACRAEKRCPAYPAGLDFEHNPQY